LYKFFAKTLFLGKNIIFLPECHSTNDLAKRMTLTNGSVVITDHQTRGRGQHGNVWLSEPGKNLLFTVVLKDLAVVPSEQYLLNVASALTLYEVLQNYIPHARVEVKWPNDIYINNFKVAGILTETSISANKLEAVYLGMGLNVNQSHFALRQASSLKILTQKEWERSDLLENILLILEKRLEQLEKSEAETLVSDYEAVLRWKDEWHTFRSDGQEFEGKISGINATGKLNVLVGNDTRAFGVQDIEYLY